MSVDVKDVGSKRSKWSSYQKYVIGLLLVVYTFNFIDRQIIAILSPAIKAELGLSDTQLGLLKGLPFAIFYAVFGFPIARLADRKNRVTIISVAIALWSGMTVLCGAAQSYIQLLLARMGVGVGEAGCSPPAHSLISDYFPKSQRATALGIYSLGISFGTLFGILLGGLIADAFGWRWAFVLVGLPGILLAIIVKLTLKEPVRGTMDGLAKAATAPTPPIAESFVKMWEIKSFRVLCFSGALSAFCSFALALWIVDFLFRSHGLTYANLTWPLALVIGIGGGLGTVLGGYIADLWGRKDESAYFSFIALAYVLSVPFFVLAIWAGTPALCFGVFFFVFLLHNSVAGPSYALVQNLAPVKLRAFAAALFLFILSVIGMGLGPLYIGMLSDFWEPSMGEADALRWALTTLAPIWVIAGMILFIARKALLTDLKTNVIDMAE